MSSAASEPRIGSIEVTDDTITIPLFLTPI